MSVHKCKRCKYTKYDYNINYELSARNQKVCWIETKLCERCNYEKPGYREHHECSLNEIPEYLNVDLTRIVHECNHESFDGITYEPTFDDDGNCVKLMEIRHFRCSYCGKRSDYKLKEEFTISNPHPKMLEFTNDKKRSILTGKHKDGICPITGKEYHVIDKGWFNDRPFMSVEHVEDHCSECDCILDSYHDSGYISHTGFWWK